VIRSGSRLDAVKREDVTKTEASGCISLSQGFLLHFSLSTKECSRTHVRCERLRDEAEPPAGAHPVRHHRAVTLLGLPSLAADKPLNLSLFAVVLLPKKLKSIIGSRQSC